MAKSMRSKREKRLRAIRREIVEPFYEKKDVAKLAAQDAALAAPKLPVRTKPSDAGAAAAMDATTSNPTETAPAAPTTMDIEMDDGELQFKGSLKPTGGIGKKSKRSFKVGKAKRRGKGKLMRRRYI